MLERVGLWSRAVATADQALAVSVAGEVDAAGIGHIWIPELSGGHDIFTSAALLLGATTRLKVGTAVANVLRREPEATAGAHRALREVVGDRFLLGLGSGHIEARRRSLRSPSVSMMGEYFAAMDAVADHAYGRDRLLAALGPRMLRLAREEAAGAITFLSTSDHTRRAREIIGTDRRLIVVQSVAFPGAATPASDLARGHVEHYGRLSNYRKHLERMALVPTGGPTRAVPDEVVDALVATGEVEDIRRRLQEHIDAGADAVCVDPLGEHGSELAAMRRAVPLIGELAALLG